MKIYRRIYNYLNNLSDYWYIVIMVILVCFIDVLIGMLAIIFNINFNGPKFDISPIAMLILAGIVGPILETYLFQVVLLYLLSKINYLNNNKILLIIIASMIFGIGHHYSFSYIIFGFLAGLIFNYSYLIYKNKTMSSFAIVLSIHSIYNIIMIVLHYLFIK
ncbi:CPBP family intramembrane glutamic endopeptidase [Thermoanaerobacter sp. A7A]|jgi:hypothetical protein|uniref:CPBP family intramembrane glutamic endopeptidase n=1 Tax=Thermoanaerobacter sp. A7A TaxID=1350366 RepID=UPI00042608FB|nr:CPBP family intramembrane glutamic endopeptidase [Thermoanaerobacter sp. A7A]